MAADMTAAEQGAAAHFMCETSAATCEKVASSSRSDSGGQTGEPAVKGRKLNRTLGVFLKCKFRLQFFFSAALFAACGVR